MMTSWASAVGADVVEQVEVGVQQVAAALVQLLDVAGGQRDLDAVALRAVSGSQPSASMTAVASR